MNFMMCMFYDALYVILPYANKQYLELSHKYIKNAHLTVNAQQKLTYYLSLHRTSGKSIITSRPLTPLLTQTDLGSWTKHTDANIKCVMLIVMIMNYLHLAFTIACTVYVPVVLLF